MSGFARVSPPVVAIAVALLASACTAGVVATNPTTPSSSVPTAAASAAPIATPAAPPSPTPAPTLPPSGQIVPGTYRSDFMTYTLPAGWSSFQGVGANKLGGAPPNGMVILPWRGIATVYHDPCHWQTTAVSVGPTVADEVAALVAQKRGSTVTPVDVTIDGFHGKQVDLMVPLDLKIAACDQSTYKSWTDTTGADATVAGLGQHERLDILDVNGQPLAILTTFYAANTATDRAELQAIVDSMKITP